MLARPELGLDTILPKAAVQQVLKEQGAAWRRVFYTPWLTFWAFFWQVLSPDRSCRAAVKRIAAGMARRGEKIDEDTGPYCKARARCSARSARREMTYWCGGGPVPPHR